MPCCGLLFFVAVLMVRAFGAATGLSPPVHLLLSLCSAAFGLGGRFEVDEVEFEVLCGFRDEELRGHRTVG